MAVQLRSVLKPLFAKGQRPKEQHFHDWLDSFYHKTEDPISITGWVFRSFFKELRAEGVAAITNGGLSMIDIPISATRLKAIRVFGNGVRTVPANGFTVTVSLIYFSDQQIAALNGVPNDIPQMPVVAPPTFFRHALVGNLTAPPLTFPIVVPAAPVTTSFDGTLTFPAPGISLAFNNARFFRLIIDATTNITFPNATNSFIYYGFQYE